MQTKLIAKEEIARGTMLFAFEKPDGFLYKAGQSVDITLLNPPETDVEGNTRAFSLASAPYEDRLFIATRMRDTAFKRVLKNMPMGTAVEITEPMGSFTLHNDVQKPAVFLIGGIGITPIRSILLDATERKLPHKLVLFYSNRQPQDAAFLNELTTLQEKNPNFQLIATMTQTETSEQQWAGEKGYITAATIQKHVPDTQGVWYLAGPAPMVKTMRGILSQLQVDEDFIKTEEFPGY